MASLQVKNFPDTLHRRLRSYAQKHHRTMSDIVLAAIEREMTRCEWHEKLLTRPAVKLGEGEIGRLIG